MPKLVLDTIIRDKPNKNDLLVWDDKKQSFVEIAKEDFLKDTTLEINKLNEEITNLNKQIELFKTQMSQMAKIIKERVI